MTMYNIINCMKADGKNFSGMCVFASAITNAIRTAKGEQMPKKDYTWEQRNKRFHEYIGDMNTMRNMWNAIKTDDEWKYEDLRHTEELLYKIWWKYNK